MITSREKLLTQTLWFDGPLSRSELHERMGLTPNGVGELAKSLISQGMLCESISATPAAPGRPRVPLDIDGRRRDVVGIAISPGMVGSVRLGLRGNPLGAPVVKPIGRGDKPLTIAKSMLKSQLRPSTLGIGISVTGFVDVPARRVLLSSSFPDDATADLSPLLEAAGDVPVLIDNDMHAAAARWMLEHRSPPDRDVLLVGIGDGRVGAATLIGGKPNAGCVIGANELGHMRFGIDTDRCYCGQVGCAERLFSTAQLRRLDPATDSLEDRAARYAGADTDVALETVVGYLASTVANAVNFLRPHQVVLAGGSLFHHGPFANLLLREVRSKLLAALVDRVRFDLWDRLFEGDGAPTAGWLALAGLICRDWTPGIGH